MDGVTSRAWLVVTVAAVTLTLTGGPLAAGDIEAGMAKAKSCAGCHGKSGEGKGDNPALAGKSAADLMTAMNEYKSGARDHKMKNRLAKKWSDEDIADLAAYYASLK